MRNLAICFAILFAAGCADTGQPDKSIVTRKKPIAEVHKEYSGQLMAVPGVVGTAIALCQGKPCIKVYVKEKTEEQARRIPAEIDGYPVVTEETGALRALPQE